MTGWYISKFYPPTLQGEFFNMKIPTKFNSGKNATSSISGVAPPDKPISWFKNQVTSRQLHKPPSPRGVNFLIGWSSAMFSRGVLPNKTPKKLIRKTTGRFQSFKPWNSQAKKKKWPARKEVCSFFEEKNVARIPQITSKKLTPLTLR